MTNLDLTIYHFMRALLYLLFLMTIQTSGQSSNIEHLKNQRVKFQKIVRAYEDSLADIEYMIAEVSKENFDKSIDEGKLIVYSNSGAPLRSGPSNFDSKLIALPKDTRLRVVGNTGIYLRVESEYGNGYVSRNLIKEEPSVLKTVKRTSNFTPPIERSYSTSVSRKTKSHSSKAVKKRTYSSSSYRNYIRGPRGGCYYINSNGNKTYVSRSLCN